MDNYDPRWVWYAAATVGLAAAAGFASLQLRASDRLKEETPAAEPSI
jgi:hypothetical protein